ncbi:hypothetical protein CR513_52277, partial [Mucuna pruriens]
MTRHDVSFSFNIEFSSLNLLVKVISRQLFRSFDTLKEKKSSLTLSRPYIFVLDINLLISPRSHPRDPRYH